MHTSSPHRHLDFTDLGSDGRRHFGRHHRQWLYRDHRRRRREVRRHQRDKLRGQFGHSDHGGCAGRVGGRRRRHGHERRHIGDISGRPIHLVRRRRSRRSRRPQDRLRAAPRVTITGTNLIGATAVNFGGTAATGYTVNSATQITATSPAHAAGTIDVTVTTAGGTSATSAADNFTYVAAPTVTSISPTSGPAPAARP